MYTNISEHQEWHNNNESAIYIHRNIADSDKIIRTSC